MRNWYTVNGHIRKYEVKSFKKPLVHIMATYIKPSVLYSYDIAGSSYVSSRITLEDHTLISDPESNSYPWPDFEQNAACTVYVDPANPGNSVLLKHILPHRINHYISLSIAGALLILTGLYINYA